MTQNLGRYQIIEQIGAGAMGAVYKARDPAMGRDVAIKTILTQAIEGPQSTEFRERFFREAQAAGRLAHPGIVTVYDVSEHEGTPFLVMEFVAGRTLQSILQSGERMDMDRVCDVGIQLAEALDYAHRRGVVHRDVKPANILITPEGRAKIADFGIARLADSQVTSTGLLLGTPAFMAPEQFTGSRIDGRVDLFAAGVVIYWMATGDKPFTGDSILAVQYKVVNADPVPPRKLNPALAHDFEAVILKSVAKNPGHRYQSGEALARDLRGLRAGRPVAIRAAAVGSDGRAPASAADVTLKTEKTVVLRSHTNAAAPVWKQPKRIHATPLVIGAAAILVGVLAALGIVRTLTHKPAAQTALSPAVPVPAAVPAPAPPLQPPAPPVQNAAPTQTGIAKAAKQQASPRSPSSDAGSNAGEIPPAGGAKGPVGSPARQRDLAQSASSVRLLIRSPAIPEFVTVLVWMDNALLFRHDATAPPPADPQPRRGIFHRRGIPTVPLAEERLLPPGDHRFQVRVMSESGGAGQAEELTANFDPGERRTLLIRFVRDSQRGEGRQVRLIVTIQ